MRSKKLIAIMIVAVFMLTTTMVSAEEIAGNTNPASVDQVENTAIDTLSSEMEIEGEGEEAEGYAFTIKGADSQGNDVLEGTFNGEAIKSCNVILGVTRDGENPAEYSGLAPTDAQTDYDEVCIYSFDEEGAGTLVTDDGIVTIAWFELKGEETLVNSADYYVESGAIVTKSEPWNITLGGKRYTISETGKANLFNGLYSGYWYVSGEKGTGSAFYGVTGGYLYKVTETGSAAVYKEKKSGTYYKLALAQSGKRYIVKVTKKTGKATVYKKDKKRSGNYKYTYGSKLYDISYSTGQVAGLYSGIYSNKLYQDGVLLKVTGIYYGKYVVSGLVKTSSKTWYKIMTVDGVQSMYVIAKDGTIKVYIKDKNRADTFKYVSGDYIYNVYYNTGLIESKQDDSTARAAMVENALKYVGYAEDKTGAMSHMRIVNDIYNKYYKTRKITPPRGYVMKTPDAWCATYVSAMFIDMKWQDIYPLEIGCRQQVAMWQKKGRWVEDDAYVPKPGDIIYYCWSDSGKGDCKGTANHVGIVERVEEDNHIVVIEGNAGAEAGHHSVIEDFRDGNHYKIENKKQVPVSRLYVNSKYIRGYGLPQYINKVN